MIDQQTIYSFSDEMIKIAKESSKDRFIRRKMIADAASGVLSGGALATTGYAAHKILKKYPNIHPAAKAALIASMPASVLGTQKALTVPKQRYAFGAFTSHPDKLIRDLEIYKRSRAAA